MVAKIKHRPLDDTKSVSLFLENILEVNVTASKEASDACVQIRDAENLLSRYSDCSTIISDKCRHPKYHDNADREKLRELIISELISKKRLKDDNKIRLGLGGLLPKGRLMSERKMYLITGLPASGKSGIAERIADEASACLIDNDYAKRKFPEFEKDYGAAVVHDEAQMVCEGQLADAKFEGPNIVDQAILAGANIVLPKICPTERKVRQVLDFFRNCRYKCYLVHVQLSREQATRRAYKRFLTTQRYVPLSMIHDGYANDPTVAYFETRHLPAWSGYARLSTEVAPGSAPKILDWQGLPKALKTKLKGR